MVKNKLIYNIHFSVRNERKNFRTMLKFIYPYLFCYDDLKINEIDVNFWQLVLQRYSYPFLFTNLHFSVEKKTISEVIYTCSDNLFADKPKNVRCESHDLQINPTCPF